MARGFGLRHRLATTRTLFGIVCGLAMGLMTGLYNQGHDPLTDCHDFLNFALDSSPSKYVQANRPDPETWKRLYNSHTAFQPGNNLDRLSYSVRSLQDYNKPDIPRKKLVLIGVMTAAKYLRTRAIATIETWARTIPGKVIYFSSEGSEALLPAGFPVVGLKGVDDTYPPQKKSFLMLKYMYEYYGEEYEWFMRVDDDIYVKGDKLESFLRSINSTLAHFIGQAGLGNPAEFGKLSLDRKENYCMGGSGMVFSAPTLQRMVPHISYCLKNLYTTHEDVEIGRCVSKFAKVSCTWAYEMQSLFYHNTKDANGSFIAPLRTTPVERAITMHPVKDHQHQYRIHTHFLSRRAQSLRHRSILMQRAIHEMNQALGQADRSFSTSHVGQAPSLMKFVPEKRQDILAWDFISKAHYTSWNLNPKQSVENSIKPALDDIIRQFMEGINLNARQRGRTIDFKELLYGYRRVDPMHGANYILDLLLVYRKHKGRKMTIQVRRHAYLQQAFSELEFREDPYTDTVGDYGTNSQGRSTVASFMDVIQSHLGMFSFASNQPSSASQNTAIPQVRFEDKVLYFILTISGRFEKFQSFMLNFEEVVLKREKRAVMSVMLFRHATEDRTSDMQALVRDYQRLYPQHRLQLHEVEGPFSRGLGLEKGGLLHGPNALIVFIDVDMYLHKDSLNRIKLNTIQGKQVYFPVVFSQFDPVLFCNGSCVEQLRKDPTLFQYSEVAGYWRHFGYGIAAMYNSDFQKVGGFDKDIEGWGSEDVKLHETFVKQNYSVFRAAEPGLVHIFHPIHCDPELESSQYRMCLGTKSSTFASILKLSEIVYANPTIYRRNEGPPDTVVDAQVRPPMQRQLEPNQGPQVAGAANNVLQERNGAIPQIRRPGM